jgi:predicted GNAT superfamily acetyltransferase
MARGVPVRFPLPDLPRPGVRPLVGVAPDRRGDGLARDLYERFFEAARAAGRSSVRCVTSPVNTGSIAFHTKLGFEIEAEVEGYDGPDGSRVLLRRAL